MSDQWWPSGTDDPAFQIQRQPYGQIVGGDYVRARSGGITTLPQTALRYATRVKGWDEIANKALMVVRPYAGQVDGTFHSYDTMEVIWGWPEKIKNWTEVALVRSGFGRPVTPNDGQTVFRGTREAMTITFSEDGETINGPIVYDRPLPNGRWYYYTVFFKVNLDWVVGMQMGSPLPKRWGHQEHLWDRLPPWYQFTDDNIRVGDGFLRQFLNVFGYELDLTREYIEEWQQLYHIDFAPMRLLRKLGLNFNVPYEQGLGDIRFRGILSDITPLYLKRGTVTALEGIIEAASQYDVEITVGDNIMLLPEDSEFVTGTGSWTAVHPDLVKPNEWAGVTLNTPTETTISNADVVEIPPPLSEGRGVLQVSTTKEGSPNAPLGDFVVCCGCGVRQTPGPIDADGNYTTIEKDVIPLYGGVPVREGVLYGFSVWVREPNPAITRAGIMWFSQGGKVVDFLDVTEPPEAAIAPADDGWYQYTVQSTPLAGPPPGTYLVPYVRINNTQYDRTVHLAGALVYALGESGVITAFAPDQYLTLGDPQEVMGVSREEPPYDAYVLGEPGG